MLNVEAQTVARPAEKKTLHEIGAETMATMQTAKPADPPRAANGKLAPPSTHWLMVAPD